MTPTLDLAAALALEVLGQMNLAPGKGRAREENWIKILVAHFERVQRETREALKDRFAEECERYAYNLRNSQDLRRDTIESAASVLSDVAATLRVQGAP